MKRQEDGWLDAVKKSTFRKSILVSFYQSSIRDQFLSFVHNLGEESRLGQDSSANLDCRPD